MGLECCGHQEENPAILERARALQEAGRESLRKRAKVGSMALSRIYSGFIQMFTKENPEPGGEVGWAGVSCLVRGTLPWESSSHGPRHPGHSWSCAMHSSLPPHSWRGMGRVWPCGSLSWTPPPPSLPCPITTSFHRGLGRPPRSAPDTSTKHTSNQMPPTGVSAPLFWVVSHPFTLCPLLGPVGCPGGPRHPSSSLGFHAEKGSLCNHICKVSFWAACIDQGLSWEMNGPPESG